jgi:8-oxo-dGTP pyrophosphatase MutT (NUDIX family)
MNAGSTSGSNGEPPVEPLADEPSNPTIVKSERVYTGKVWNIASEDFEYNGHSLTREFVDHTGAVAVLAMDDAGRVLLIQQYRHPIREREWELPAGLLDIEGEDPLVAAQRELAEEVDLVASDWSELISFHTSPGGSNELLHVYLAKGLVATDTAYDRAEEEADIVTRWVELDDVVAAVLASRVRNSILAIAVLAAHAKR